MILYRSIIRYINVGRLLHLIAFLDLIVTAVAIYFILTLDSRHDMGLMITWSVVLIMFGGMSVYAELDGYSRFQDYKRVKDQLYFYGYQDRILRPMSRSRCQRDAGQLACDEFSIGKKSKEYFTDSGYKWYHIIPDFVLEDPGFFFKSYFWHGTFFTPYYEPRVDYAQIDPADLDLSVKTSRIEPTG